MDTVILKFTPETQFDDDELFAFCAANSDLRIERNNKGELIIMSPSGGKTGNIHIRIYSALSHWLEKHTNLGYFF